MQNHELRRWISGVRTTLTAAAVLSTAAFSLPAHAADMVRLSGHVPAVTATSTLLGHVTHTKAMPLAIALPLRNQAQLKDLIRRQQDPQDALYKHYLKPSEFADRFGATKADYDAVIAFAKSKGLTVTGTHANRLLVDVSGKPADVEAAFGVRLNNFRKPDGTTYFAPDANPALPAAIAGKIKNIFGLSSAARPHSLARMLKPLATDFSLPDTSAVKTAQNVGTFYGYLDPADIQRIYNLDDGVYFGNGQRVALFELGGYYDYDIAAYEYEFHLPNAPIQVVPVDGYDGSPGGAYQEAALDIDATLAAAPAINQILVYEAPEGDGSIAGIAPYWLDELSKIASDDRASQVSMSYGLAEDIWIADEGIDFITNEDVYFQEMAAQGQSVYVASGDNGAYADGQMLSVLSPASDPYVTAVGGTSLTTDSNYQYQSETTWNDLELPNGATGGGISTVWAETPWQLPFINAGNKGSTVARNIPDVSIVGDPQTGFVVYLSQGSFGAGFYIFGGTSLSSPLWSGFNAKVNQEREDAGIGPVGFVAPSLYGIYASGLGQYDFHDIADGSTNGDTNLFPGMPGFPAVPGYDLATGLGSYIGYSLLQDLGGYPSSYAPPLNPTNVVASAGDGYVNLKWNKSQGAASYLIYRYPGPGGYFEIIKATKSLSFQDTNVTNGTTYEYQVSAVGRGGQSNYLNASIVAATPDVVQITTLPLALPASTGTATVTWQTNVLADATVAYGLTPKTVTALSASDHHLLYYHTVTLTGLTPGTTYFFRVADYDGKVTVHSPTYSFVAH